MDEGSNNIEIIKQHYAVLREYLEAFIPTLANRAPSTAMARVGRLPATQFYEVSSDLYDELKRRLNNPEERKLQNCIQLIVCYPFSVFT